MKKCLKCYQEKDLIEFGRAIYRNDGLNAYCKSCINEKSKKHRLINKEKNKKYAIEYREKNRELLREKSKIDYYNNWQEKRTRSNENYNKRKEEIALQRATKSRLSSEKEKNRIRQKKWREQNKSRVGEVVTGWKKRNPQKAAAHSLVLWAVRSGVLKKPDTCKECNMVGKLEGHHIDYLKPLEVIWLCKNCHSNKHKIIGKN